jgi:hypothetical protein
VFFSKHDSPVALMMLWYLLICSADSILTHHAGLVGLACSTPQVQAEVYEELKMCNPPMNLTFARHTGRRGVSLVTSCFLHIATAPDARMSCSMYGWFSQRCIAGSVATKTALMKLALQRARRHRLLRAQSFWRVLIALTTHPSCL